MVEDLLGLLLLLRFTAAVVAAAAAAAAAAAGDRVRRRRQQRRIVLRQVEAPQLAESLAEPRALLRRVGLRQAHLVVRLDAV
eukprot:6813169-Prymnesium_polylepis.1